jgi:hypothetical protein
MKCFSCERGRCLHLGLVPRPQGYLIPNEGDQVIIACQEQRFQAVVSKKAPRGDFTVSWRAGSNRFAPYLAGHWYTEFGPNGEPKHQWRIVEILKETHETA